MIALPVGFDLNLYISELVTLGLPFVSVAVAFVAFTIILRLIRRG